jgi:hypothetical protein
MAAILLGLTALASELPLTSQGQSSTKSLAAREQAIEDRRIDLSDALPHIDGLPNRDKRPLVFRSSLQRKSRAF